MNKTYRLNRSGRRKALVLCSLSTVAWILAVLKLPDVLSVPGVRVRYLDPASWSSAITQGLTVTQIVPALLLLVLIVAAPLLVWNLVEEWFTTYTVRDDGLEYDTVQGISVVYPWSAITGLRRVDPETATSDEELIVDGVGVHQINNRVLRWLHQQAFGSTRIPIYAQITDRDELINEIITRSGLQPLREQREGNHEQPVS